MSWWATLIGSYSVLILVFFILLRKLLDKYVYTPERMARLRPYYPTLTIIVFLLMAVIMYSAIGNPGLSLLIGIPISWYYYRHKNSQSK